MSAQPSTASASIAVLVALSGCLGSDDDAGGGSPPAMTPAQEPRTVTVSSGGMRMREVRFSVTSEQLGGVLPGGAAYHVLQPSGSVAPPPELMIDARAAAGGEGYNALELRLSDDAMSPPVGSYVVGESALGFWALSDDPEQTIRATTGTITVHSVDGGLIDGSFELTSASNGSSTKSLEGRFSGRWDLDCSVIWVPRPGEVTSPGVGEDGEPQWRNDPELETEFCARVAADVRPPQE